MDAAVGFPPFWEWHALPRRHVARFDPSYKGTVVDYQAMALAAIGRYGKGGKVCPGVCASWDNEARRPGKGSCFDGSTPVRYGQWLRAACNSAMTHFPPGERLVFINARNEWAEGAYLEPDRHLGCAYLAETASVLEQLAAVDAVPREEVAGPISSFSAVPAAAALAPVSAHDGRRRRLARRVAGRLALVADDLSSRLRSIG